MSTNAAQFGKYDDWGAYHWVECDKHSSRYNPPLEARYAAVARRVQGAKRLLDVGCGDGYLLNLVSACAERVTGIEYEATGAALAAEKLKFLRNCDVRQGSCYELPFADQSFDFVLLADVIEHLARPEHCLREISRVLSTEGTLLLTTPQFCPGRPLGYGHVKEYSPEDLIQSLEPFFSQVELIYLWPKRWFRLYNTKVGWRLIPIFARHFYNPFLQEGPDARHFDQMLAICRSPRKASKDGD